MNCLVTTNNVNNVEKIFGPNIGTLKGKTTQNLPKAVKADYIEIRKEIMKLGQDLTLCMDIMFINRMPMLMAIDWIVQFRLLVLV